MSTQIFNHINWLAVIVAALAYFVLGAFWYSKSVFGHTWAKTINLDLSNPDLKKGMGKMMLFSFLLMAVTCTGLALLIVKVNFADEFTYGIKIGLLTGICYASMAVSINYVYEKKPLMLYLINNGYHVLGHIIAATILILWR